jgi:hypothetical protein
LPPELGGSFPEGHLETCLSQAQSGSESCDAATNNCYSFSLRHIDPLVQKKERSAWANRSLCFEK